jgi:hypothetical protein
VHHPTFSPSPTKAQSKCSHAEQPTATSQDSPTKKKFKKTEENRVSTTAETLKAIAEGGEKKGLLKFFQRETVEEREQRMRRERVESDLWQHNAVEDAVLKARQDAAGKEIERYEAKMRKRKSRNKIYDRERAAGLRDENLRLKRRKVS